MPTLLGAVLLLAAVVRIYDIGGNPPGFFADEASFGYNAYTILHAGKDEYGKTLPIFFRAFGEYKLPVYTYSQIPFIAVFGLSELAVRLTTATYGILTVLAVYLLVRALSRQQALALAAAAVLAVLPWHIHYSRTGLGDITTHLFFLVFGLYLFILGTRRPPYWLAAALAFALALYSYRAAWVLVPPLLLVLAVLYHRELIKHWRFALAGVLILAAASLPIAIHLLSVDTDRSQEQSIFSLDLSTQETIKRFFDHYRLHFTTSFLFEGAAEQNLRHVVPGSGWLYWWQAPFIMLGLLALLRKPSRPKLLVLALLLLFPLATSVARDSPSSNRGLIGAVAFSIITAYGIAAAASLLTRWQRPQVMRMAGFGLAGILVLGTTVAASTAFASYLGNYHGRYQQISAGYWGWQWGARQIIERFVAVEDEYDQVLMDGTFNAPQIFPRFYAPNDCRNCVTGIWDKVLEFYDPTQKQLFALRPETMRLTFEYDVKGTLYYPNGKLAFVFAEVTGTRSLLRGNLPNRNLGDSEEAIAELDKAIEREPNSASAYAHRGLAYLELGDAEQALRDLTRAIGLDHNLAEALANRGNAYWALDDFEPALREYGTAIELDPDQALAYYNRGNAYATQGAYDRAIDDYRRAIELDPTLAEAHNNMGNTYNQGDQHDRAIPELDKAIELDPRLALAYANRGTAYGNVGILPQALLDLDEAVELNPNLAFAYARRGEIHRSLGRLDRALADFDKAIELDPNYAEAYANRGLIHAVRGDLDQAIADQDKAIELHRDYALAYAQRGVAYLNLRDLDQALADLDKAVELDRAYALAPSNRRIAYWHLGDAEQAAADLEQALSRTSDPNRMAQLEEIIDYLDTR